ncbi:MAG: hypothetical protein Q4C53_02500 [Clostridia bacterium]|nr:hypothetical protein [Clostridia bacterium]
MRWKRKLAAAGTAVVAGVCMLFALHTETPEPRQESTQGISVCGKSGSPREHALPSWEAEETRRDAARRRFFGLPAWLKTLWTLPAWCIGKLLLFLFRKSFPFVSPFVASVAEFVLGTLLLAAWFGLVWKLLFPERPLRTLFRNGRWRWIPVGAAVCICGDRLLTLLSEDWRRMRILLGAVLTASVMTLLYARLFRKVPPPHKKINTIDIQRVE